MQSQSPSISSSPRLVAAFRDFEVFAACSTLAGLYVLTSHQPYRFRIEVLLRLCLLHCKGDRVPTAADVEVWANQLVDLMPHWAHEDPPEDCHAYNIALAEGNFLIIQGLQPGDGWKLQDLLDATFRRSPPPESDGLYASILWLLQASADALEASGIRRWETYLGKPERHMPVPDDETLAAVRSRMLLPRSRQFFDVSHEVLASLCQGASDAAIDAVDCGLTPLRPLLRSSCGGRFALIFPGSLALSLRKCVLDWLAAKEVLPELARTKRRKNIHTAYGNVLTRQRRTVTIEDPGTVAPDDSSHRLWDASTLRFDEQLYCIQVLIHEDLTEPRTSYQERRLLPSDVASGIAEYVRASLARLRAAEPQACGMYVFILESIDRELKIEIDLDPSWPVFSIELSDIESLVGTELFSFARMYKFLMQQRQATDWGLGFRIPDLDLFALWVSHFEYSLVPRDFDTRVVSSLDVRILPGALNRFRQDFYRSHDLHGIPRPNGVVFERMRRVFPFRVYPDLPPEPLYGAHEAAAFGYQFGAVEGQRCAWWVGVRYQEEHPDADLRFLGTQLWESVLEWLAKTVSPFEELVAIDGQQIEMVWIDVALSADRCRLPPTREAIAAALDRIGVEQSELGLVVRINADTFPAFAHPENIAEKRIAVDILEQLGALAGDTSTDIRELVDAAVPGAFARHFHIFTSCDAGDQFGIQHMQGEPRFLYPEDRATARWGLGWRANNTRGSLSDQGECCQLLQGITLDLWREIHSTLVSLDRTATVRLLLDRLEDVQADRGRWAMTARAMAQFHGTREQALRASHTREQQRAVTASATRVLVEMSSCHTRIEGGSSPSQLLLDRLLALAAEIINLGMQSDAIYNEFAAASIEVAPRGDVGGEQEDFVTTTQGYLHSSFGGLFAGHEAEYDQHYEFPGERGPSGEWPSWLLALNGPFRSEYGLDLRDFGAVYGFLMDEMFDRNSRLLHMDCSALHDVLLASEYEFDLDALHCFVDQFGLVQRKDWTLPPVGFKQRDINPWRSRRRLSLVYRPVVRLTPHACGPILVGYQSLRSSFNLLLGHLRDGWMPQHFFRTKAMRSFLGSRTKEEGYAFERDVLQTLRSFGWEAETRTMRSLGAPSKLGDVDALAVDPSGKVLVVGECKRLQSVVSVAEMAEQVRAFQGKKDDRLFRHLRRVSWIREHIEQVGERLGTRPLSVRSVLITNLPQVIAHAPAVKEQVDLILSLADIRSSPSTLTNSF